VEKRRGESAIEYSAGPGVKPPIPKHLSLFSLFSLSSLSRLCCSKDQREKERKEGE